MHAGRGGALRQEAGVVEDKDAVGLAESFGCVVLEVVAELVGLPAGAVEELAQAVGGPVSRVFSQLPAVLAADRAQQSTDVVTRTAMPLDAFEAVAGPPEQFLEVVVPDLNCTLVDYARRLPRALPLPIEGWSGKENKGRRSGHYTHRNRP